MNTGSGIEAARLVVAAGDLAYKLHHSARSHEGGTFSIFGDEVRGCGATTWAVGSPEQSMVAGAEVLSLRLIEAWIDTVIALDPDQQAFGVWYEGKTALTHFDAVDLLTKERAIETGLARGEKAIYDLKTDTELFLEHVEGDPILDEMGELIGEES